MSDTCVIKRFKVRNAYKVFTEELGISEGMAEGLVHRDYWFLLDKMRDVASEDTAPPLFNNNKDLDEFLLRCDDVAAGYIYKFDAYSGEVQYRTHSGVSRYAKKVNCWEA